MKFQGKSDHCLSYQCVQDNMVRQPINIRSNISNQDIALQSNPLT